MTESKRDKSDHDGAKTRESRAREVAARFRDIRIGSGLTLREVAAATGLSLSQVSKLETGAARLTVDLALRMSAALRVPTNAFFLEPNSDPQSIDPVVTRSKGGLRHRLKGIDFEVLCGEAQGKHALNWCVTVHGKSLEACGGLRSHAGEEFLHVLSGGLVVYFASAKPVRLESGDSLVFNGVAFHGYAAPDGPAVAIMTNSVVP